MERIYVDMLGPGFCFIVDKKQGGFGDVLILSQDGHRPSHALKLIRTSGDGLESLKREVNQLSLLPPHPNVIAIEGLAATDVGTGILMPYHPSTLRETAKLSSPKTRIDLVRLAAQTLEGLAFLHSRGVLHLDIKPQNILLTAEGIPVLSDFGLARSLEGPAIKQNPQLQMLSDGAPGTLAYMAPEQVLESGVSVKTDVFAFGSVLFELLTGRLPFAADTVAGYARNILMQQVRFTLLEKLSIPGWLRDLVEIAMQKSPARRCSVADMLTAMRKKSVQKAPPMDPEDRIIRDINRAGAMLEAGQVSKGVELLEQVLAQDPWQFTALINLAEAYFISGRVNDAIRLATTAHSMIAFFPEHAKSEPVICLNLALYLMTRDPSAAYKITTASVAKFPDNWELLHNHAEACRLMSIQVPEKAASLIAQGVSAAEAALRLGPSDENLRITYAGLLRHSGRREQFVPYLNQLMKDVGEHSVAAWVLYLEANLDEGNLDLVDAKIKELSTFSSFKGVLSGVEKRLHALRTGQRG